MKKFSKILLISFLSVFLLGGSALALNWVVSPYSPSDGTIVFGETDVVGVQEIGDGEYEGGQTSAIYGAGFLCDVNAIYFDVDLYTWDSYTAQITAGTGWWDVFVVNINQVGFYWDLVAGGSGSITDPVISSDYMGGYGTFDNSVLPGATWAFGGAFYGDGTLDSTGWSGPFYLGMEGGDPALPYYVSVILDTKTEPHADTSYASWGSFHVSPVPEPATMLLLGSGLIGIAGIGRKKLFNKS